MESAASAASAAASATASAVKRASRRLTGGGRGSSSSGSSGTGSSERERERSALAMLEAVLTPWLEEEGIAGEERAARESTAAQMRRAQLHQFCFATEAEEMAWLEEEKKKKTAYDAARPRRRVPLPQSLAEGGLDTPSKVWEAVSTKASGTGRGRLFLAHFYDLGPNVVIDAPISRLPVDWCAPGLLVITPSSESLPDGLRVAGSLVLEGNKLEILSLPSRLEVEGDLVLRGASCLTALPDDMRVGGSFVAEGCSALVEIPASLGEMVRGSIELRDCDRLVAVPPLHVRGDLVLIGCRGVTSLSKALLVDGGLKLYMLSITSLPWDDLRVGGDLVLRHCYHLTSLPAQLRVDGNLDVLGSSSISVLPDGLEVSGDVILDILSRLVALPAGFVPSKRLSLKGCSALTALPAGLRLTSLDVTGCDALSELPGDIVVDGPAVLGKGPTTLPASARLLGDIILRATSTPLPDDLRVKGNLTIENCAYEALPAGLVVEGGLWVNRCQELTALPTDARVLGPLTVVGCQRLAGLPATVHGPVSLTRTAVQALPNTWDAVPGNLELLDCPHFSQLPTTLSVVEGGLKLRDCPLLTQLPATLRVKGGLHVRDTCVTELPWGSILHVRGDLFLEGALTRLPRDELRVDGSCVLVGSGGAQLTSLPLKLDVGGALTVSKCAIDALPVGMKVGGDVALERLPMLAALPEDLADCANKGLSLRQCPLVSALPPGLHLKTLTVDRCELLGELPNDVVVEGDFSLCCTSVSSLPATARFLGSITLHRCELLRTLPGDLHVRGNLTVQECASLTELPEGVHVEHGVDCHELASLEELAGGGLVVGGNFVAIQCPLLRKVRYGRVGGDVDVASCVMLTSLPDDMHVRGDFSINNCPSLVELPAGLTADGNLNMKDCRGITALPARLEVRGDVFATHSGLTELADGWHARGSLVLHDCVDLTALPEGLAVGGTLGLHRRLSLTSLPDDMHVRGDFSINNCPSIVELPTGLTVGGHLNMEDCRGITALPARLEVHGDVVATRSGLTELADGWHARGSLVLDECVDLVSLPTGLTVGGELHVRCCLLLTSLPDDMHVRGDFSINNCPSLVELPAGLTADGNLNMKDCRGITALPARLEVRGDVFATHSGLTELAHGWHARGSLVLHDCVDLVSLPTGLTVGGELHVRCCLLLTSLPDDMHVRGDFSINNCPNLVELPAGLTVGGHLNMEDCRGITALPARLEVRGDVFATNSGLTELADGWHARGSLVLGGCVDLIALPEGLTVGGTLGLRSCLSLTSLPDDMHVRGNFWIHDCQSLVELPTGLVIGGNLHMQACRGITTLPARLEVHGDVSATRSGLTELAGGWHARGSLVLDECVDLVSLPTGLTVGGTLGLGMCVSLVELPDDDDFHVDGDLRLLGCTGIVALPDCVLEWGMCSNGQPHNIHLQGSGLPPEELARLQALDNPALRFHVSMSETIGGDGLGDDNFPTLNDAAKFWAKEARVAGDALAIEPFVEAAYVRGVLGFLSKLRRAKEFNNSLTKAGLASRVVQVLELLTGEDNGVREELQVRMADAVDTCSDKPMWALNQMQVLVHIAEARGDRAKLRALGMGVMRLEVVHKHVREAMDAMNFVDDVCVYLRFEIALRESLNLPVSALKMLYPSYVTVTDKNIAAAEAEALRVTEADLEAWLPAWSEWQRQDRVEFAEGLDFSVLKRNSTKRLSLSLRSLLGNAVADPVRVRPAKAVWSLADLMKHWINTGMDLNNTPRNVDYMRLNLTKCI